MLTGILPHSSLIMKGHKEGHWNSLSVVSGGQDSSVRLYPDSMAEALVQNLGMEMNEEISIIWGAGIQKWKACSKRSS